MMRPRTVIATAAATLFVSMPSAACCEESVQRALTVQAEFSTRTSLKISTDVLHFDVENPASQAAAALEFSAGARTQPGGEVLLIVEPLAVNRIAPPDREEGGNGVSEPHSLQGISVVDLSTPGPKIAARWMGSGFRRGTLRAAFRASHKGRYEVPLRVVLAAP